MTRKDGIILVMKYMNQKPKHLNLFLNWLGITSNAFHSIIDQHRNTEIWTRNKNWKWVLKEDFIKELNPNLLLTCKTKFNKFKPFRQTELGISTDNVGSYKYYFQ